MNLSVNTKISYTTPTIDSDVTMSLENMNFLDIQLITQKLLQTLAEQHIDLRRSYRLEFSRFTGFKMVIRLDPIVWFDRILLENCDSTAHTIARQYVNGTRRDELERTKKNDQHLDKQFCTLRQLCPFGYKCRNKDKEPKCENYHPTTYCKQGLKSKGGIHETLVLKDENFKDQHFVTVARYEPLR
jgi:hypothetical protein